MWRNSKNRSDHWYVGIKFMQINEFGWGWINGPFGFLALDLTL